MYWHSCKSTHDKHEGATSFSRKDARDCAELLPRCLSAHSFMGKGYRKRHCYKCRMTSQQESSWKHVGEDSVVWWDQNQVNNDNVCKLHTEQHQKHTILTVDHGGSSIMPQRCFSASVPVRLMRGQQMQQKREILMETLQDSSNIFASQQDNKPRHKGKATGMA